MEERYIHVSGRSQERRGTPQRQPQHRRPPRRREEDWDSPPRRGGGFHVMPILMGFYKVLVALSVLVVAVYVGAQVLIKTPGQENITPPAGSAPVPGVSGDSSGTQREPAASGRELRKGVYNFFLAATDKGGTRSDTMMVMSYDTQAQTVGVISVPRDTLVARSSGNPHLVYGKGGVEQRIADVSDMLGIPIHYYIKVDIKGFIALVDELDGIDFYVPCDMNYDDPEQNLAIHYKEGQRHLTGQQAMEVARFRKNNDGSGYSDVGRTETQQKLLVAMAKKVLSWNNLTRINSFVEIFNQNVDTNLSLNDMLYFAKAGLNLDPSTGVETATLPGRGDGVYRGYRYCYELDREGTLDIVNRLINPYDQPLTLEDMNLAKAQSYH